MKDKSTFWGIRGASSGPPAPRAKIQYSLVPGKKNSSISPLRVNCIRTLCARQSRPSDLVALNYMPHNPSQYGLPITLPIVLLLCSSALHAFVWERICIVDGEIQFRWGVFFNQSINQSLLLTHFVHLTHWHRIMRTDEPRATKQKNQWGNQKTIK